MNNDLITDIGKYCKNVRVKQNVSLKDFASLNHDNLKNIWAFENGKANNIKYIFYYLKLFDSDSGQKEYVRGLFNIL